MHLLLCGILYYHIGSAFSNLQSQSKMGSISPIKRSQLGVPEIRVVPPSGHPRKQPQAEPQAPLTPSEIQRAARENPELASFLVDIEKVTKPPDRIARAERDAQQKMFGGGRGKAGQATAGDRALRYYRRNSFSQLKTKKFEVFYSFVALQPLVEPINGRTRGSDLIKCMFHCFNPY